LTIYQSHSQLFRLRGVDKHSFHSVFLIVINILLKRLKQNGIRRKKRVEASFSISFWAGQAD
jgi:hypothetical protein